MGPRLCSRGNSNFFDNTTRMPHGLQWGHDFAAVEMVPVRRVTAARVLLQWGHDFAAVEIWDSGTYWPPSAIGFNRATTLQPWKFKL